jgi:hypothetical protein
MWVYENGYGSAAGTYINTGSYVVNTRIVYVTGYGEANEYQFVCENADWELVWEN